MKRGTWWVAWLGALALALACGSAAGAEPAASDRATTAGAIAIDNLDHQIARSAEDGDVVDLLLARSRFLGNYDALDRAVRMTDRPSLTYVDLLRQARVLSAAHRFADALVDLDAAECAGASSAEIAASRSSILVATGHADDVIPQLENDLSKHPGFATRTSLAAAYGAVGRIADADRLYAAAAADLDTTSPFPHAWLYFVRALMWTEQARDPERGAAFYTKALAYLPEFATANVHLAELEAASGELPSAMARLERVTAMSDEPEAMALLGQLRMRAGDLAKGAGDIERARRRYESLLAKQPLAFADHAAEFYLGPGNDAERAWWLAEQNLANRETPRAFTLAIAAARATGRDREARELAARCASCEAHRTGAGRIDPQP